MKTWLKRQEIGTCFISQEKMSFSGINFNLMAYQFYQLACLSAWHPCTYVYSALATPTPCTLDGSDQEQVSDVRSRTRVQTSLFKLNYRNRVNSSERLTADADDTGVLCLLYSAPGNRLVSGFCYVRVGLTPHKSFTVTCAELSDRETPNYHHVEVDECVVLDPYICRTNYLCSSKYVYRTIDSHWVMWLVSLLTFLFF